MALAAGDRREVAVEQFLDPALAIGAGQVAQDAAGIPAQEADFALQQTGEKVEAGIQQAGILLAQAAKHFGGSVFGAGLRRR
jgi:hypothetical protein